MNSRIVMAIVLVSLTLLAGYFDHDVSLSVVKLPNTAWLSTLKELTELGKGYIYFDGLAILGLISLITSQLFHTSEGRVSDLWRRGLDFCSFSFLTFSVTGLLVLALKAAIGRARPLPGLSFSNHVFQPFNLDHVFQSFPSGHTQVAFTFAFLIGSSFRDCRWPALLYASVIGITRVLCNAHFLSDVFGGILIAWLGFLISERLFTKSVRSVARFLESPE